MDHLATPDGIVRLFGIAKKARTRRGARVYPLELCGSTRGAERPGQARSAGNGFRSDAGSWNVLAVFVSSPWLSRSRRASPEVQRSPLHSSVRVLKTVSLHRASSAASADQTSLCQQSGILALLPMAADDQPVRRARHADIEEPPIFFLCQRLAPRRIFLRQRDGKRGIRQPDRNRRKIVPIFDQPQFRHVIGVERALPSSTRNTMGASSPLEACTVMIRTSSRPLSCSRLTVGGSSSSDEIKDCSPAVPWRHGRVPGPGTRPARR